MPAVRFAACGALSLLFASCHSASGPRCFAEGVPPPWHYPHAGHDLIDGLDATQPSARECPLDHPPNGAACTLAAEAHCYYVAPGHPCDPDELLCKAGAWSGGHVEF
jgi:hypothetical protein